MNRRIKRLPLLIGVALMSLSTSVVSAQGSNEEIVLQSIMTRSSVRAYTSEKVSGEQIEKMLRAGMAAPTAGNKQPWQFIVIDDREILDAIPAIVGGARMAPQSQLAIVVAGSPVLAASPQYWIQDCSAATENILLAAHAMGLGAVWCGAYPDNAAGRVAQMRKLLNLPDEWTALNVIVIGHPSGKPTIKDKWDEEKVHYNKFE